MAKVSICIPTYQQIEFLEKNLESILIQDYEDYEVIITDDTPDDSVKEFVFNYFTKFNGKLKYYKNAKGLGSPENWNEAIRFASGEYIKMLHHDDWFTRSYSLSAFVAVLDSNPLTDFAFSASLEENYKTKTRRVYRISNDRLRELRDDPTCLFFGNWVGAPSATIFRRNINLSFDKNFKWLVDFEFYIRVLKRNGRFVFLTEELIGITSSGKHNVTNDCENNKHVEIFEFFHLFKKIKNLTKGNIFSYLRVLFNLIEKYDVRNVNEIKETGYQQRIPFQIGVYIFCRNAARFLKLKGK